VYGFTGLPPQSPRTSRSTEAKTTDGAIASRIHNIVYFTVQPAREAKMIQFISDAFNCSFYM
jgi:hypothetical protein